MNILRIESILLWVGRLNIHVFYSISCLWMYEYENVVQFTYKFMVPLGVELVSVPILFIYYGRNIVVLIHWYISNFILVAKLKWIPSDIWKWYWNILQKLVTLPAFIVQKNLNLFKVYAEFVLNICWYWNAKVFHESWW